jgi:alpha-L-rhamnosidase
MTDWVLAEVGAPEADQDDFEALAWRAHRVGLVARSARVLGREREATVYKRMHRTHVRRLWDEFLTPRGRLAVDTQTAHALALAFHLFPADFCQRNFERLAALVEANREPFDPSVLDTAALCQVLAAGGRLDLAYQLLLKESDTPAASVSRGAGEWMYQAVGGLELDPEVSGFQKLVFHPQPGGGIKWARSCLMTPHGTAASAWTVNDAGWSVELEVPPDTTAVLVYPEGCTTYGSGKWTREFAGPAQPEAEAEPEPSLEPSQLSPTPSL